jgi:LPXTG-motif cell wall-anchored protein
VGTPLKLAHTGTADEVTVGILGVVALALGVTSLIMGRRKTHRKH